MGSINLSLEVLSQQVCQACGGYLSVGPVKVTSTGDVLCGRPTCHHIIEETSGVSLYNIIAAVCLYRCTYHYAGCDASLTFMEVVAHEKHCRWARRYECPFCYFHANGCQELVYHFGKTHPTYMPTEDVLRKILSYEGIGNHLDAILKMTTMELRQFMGHAPKIFRPICQNCKSNIFKRENIYFCAKYHIACQNCCKKKCKRCDNFELWTKKSVLDKILFECEWTGCSEKKDFFEYLWHKQTCGWRVYKCPWSRCEYSSFLGDLKNHWHLSPILEVSNLVQIAAGECMYWSPPSYREIVFVTFEIDGNGTGIVALNNEHNIFPIRLHVTVDHFVSGSRRYKAYYPVLLRKCDKVVYFKIEGICSIDSVTLKTFP